jgi:hypothetical protein
MQLLGACGVVGVIAGGLVVAARAAAPAPRSAAIRIEVGGVELETRDALFKIDATGGELRIGVERGSVRVHPGDRLVELANGEIRVFRQRAPAQ